jgi:hypothetical protein
VIVVVALVLVVVLKFWGQGGILPPHEFAYGTAMRNSDAIAERMDQFLSLEALDPKQVQIQTFVGNNSANDLSPLIIYISSQGRHEFGALVAALKEVDRLPDQKEKAIRLVKSLLPYSKEPSATGLNHRFCLLRSKTAVGTFPRSKGEDQ